MGAPTVASEIQRFTPEQKKLVRSHLQELMASRSFAASKRAQDLLRLLVEHALAGEVESLRERVIGAEMFNRPIDYDTANDSVVRVKATELRKKLSLAYAEFAQQPAVSIEVPPGTYVPRFSFHIQEPPATPVDPFAVGQPDAEAGIPPSAARDLFWLRARKSRWGRSKAIIVLCSAALLLSVFIAFWVWRHPTDDRPQLRSMAVLPFENLSGDPGQEYFADGITESLIDDLGQMSALRVISRTSAMSLKHTQKDLRAIAHELAVDWVVEGSVLRGNDDVRITVRLIDPKTDQRIWGDNFTRKLNDMPASQGELAQSIANELSLNVSPQTYAHLSRTTTVSVEAEDLYLQGLLALHSDNCGKAMTSFRGAIKADPNFASAYAALATCYGITATGGWMPYSEGFSNQKSNAARAIELDPSLSEGHAELAGALLAVNWDWAGARREFEQAIALNPNSAKVHEQYGSFLNLTGDSSAAVKEAHYAVTLDPLSGRALSGLAYVYYFSRQYDQAISLLEQAQAKDPRLRLDVFAFGDVYVEKGLYQKAIESFSRQGDNPHALGHLGNALARAGRTAEARKFLTKLGDRVSKDGLGAYEIALIYAGLGDKDHAFVWLQEAISHHDRGLLFLKVDPPLDPLRDDPRFDQMLLRVGLKKS